MTLFVSLPNDRHEGCHDELAALLGSYINGPTVASVFHVERDGPTLDYQLKRRQGVWSDITRARRLGYEVAEFAYYRWLEDIVEIDRSKPVRCGGPMRPHYLVGVKERGGADANATIEPKKCPVHWREMLGVFAPESDGRPRKLVAYASLIRAGGLLVVSQFMAHGGHMRGGVAHLLIREILTRAQESGVDHVMYGGATDGGAGLQDWKRRVGFEPTRLFMRGGK